MTGILHDRIGQVRITGSIHDLIAWFHRNKEEFFRQPDYETSLEKLFDIVTEIGVRTGVIDADKMEVSADAIDKPPDAGA